MPMLLPPKELLGKIEFSSRKVAVKENVTLTQKEKELFEKYRNDLYCSNKHRLD